MLKTRDKKNNATFSNELSNALYTVGHWIELSKVITIFCLRKKLIYFISAYVIYSKVSKKGIFVWHLL